MGNAAQLIRVSGTWTAKDGRRDLHRVATLEVVGEYRLLTDEQLESVAAPRLREGGAEVA